MKNCSLRLFNPSFVPRLRSTGLNLNSQTSIIEIPRPLHIEIGCGVGFHPIQWSKQNPYLSLIAIEQTTTKFNKFKNRLLRHTNLVNLYPVQADARVWISNFVSPNSVKKYFILYPNPNPKNKNSNQRWIKMPFFQFLIHTLEPGGEIEIATNISNYAREAISYSKNYPSIYFYSIKKIDPTQQPRTHFEKKYLDRGDACYNLIFKKTI